MNTTTPTGDGVSGVPAWLPDEATLTRLANEYFAALPGQPPASAGQLATPEPAAQPVTPAPAVQPASAVSAAQPAAAVSAAQPAGAVSAVRPPAPLTGLAAAGPQWPGQAYALPDLGEVPEPVFYFIDYQLPAAAPASEFPGDARDPFNVELIRRQFPILSERINGRQLVWLDNAATTQKPQVVIDRLGYFYAHENSNVHRAAHTLAARATDAYESARATVAASSELRRPRASSSPGAPPRRSTWWHRPGGARTSARATRS